ncbi:MAG: hypothetical protein R6U39_05400 [Candidatus Aegiribacteria sp.]
MDTDRYHLFSMAVTVSNPWRADINGDRYIDVVALEVLTSTPYKVAWFENDGTAGGRSHSVRFVKI